MVLNTLLFAGNEVLTSAYSGLKVTATSDIEIQRKS